VRIFSMMRVFIQRFIRSVVWSFYKLSFVFHYVILLHDDDQM